jgi:hypothetical protein
MDSQEKILTKNPPRLYTQNIFTAVINSVRYNLSQSFDQIVTAGASTIKHFLAIINSVL